MAAGWPKALTPSLDRVAAGDSTLTSLKWGGMGISDYELQLLASVLSAKSTSEISLERLGLANNPARTSNPRLLVISGGAMFDRLLVVTGHHSQVSTHA